MHLSGTNLYVYCIYIYIFIGVGVVVEGTGEAVTENLCLIVLMAA